MNAVDWRTPAERKVRYNATKKKFRGLGIKVNVVDLRKFYNKKPESLARKLQHYDMLWVRGGNSFFLRYVMKKSGFDKAIKQALAHGLVYGGASAGALVAGPTLKYIDKADDPSMAPKVIWRGIGLTNRVPLVHYKNPKYGDIIRKAFSALRKEGTLVTKLSDSEALLIEGHTWEKVKANWTWKR